MHVMDGVCGYGKKNPPRNWLLSNNGASWSVLFFVYRNDLPNNSNFPFINEWRLQLRLIVVERLANELSPVITYIIAAVNTFSSLL